MIQIAVYGIALYCFLLNKEEAVFVKCFLPPAKKTRCGGKRTLALAICF